MAEKTVDVARALLGKNVKVTLCKGEGTVDGIEAKADATIVSGVLLGIGDGGDFEVLDPMDGFVHYCWPALHIEEVQVGDGT